jgi:hypothetical protein
MTVSLTYSKEMVDLIIQPDTLEFIKLHLETLKPNCKISTYLVVNDNTANYTHLIIVDVKHDNIRFSYKIIFVNVDTCKVKMRTILGMTEKALTEYLKVSLRKSRVSEIMNLK